MANFNDAISYIFRNEGGFSLDPDDTGNYDAFGNLIGTNYGITGQVARDYGYMGPMAELPVEKAAEIYRAGYWQGLENIEDQAIATKLLDIFVNLGRGNGTRVAQNAANWFEGNNIAVDGGFGPITIEAINRCEAADYLEALVSELEGYYLDLVERKPAKQKYLTGWLNRAKKLPSMAVQAIMDNPGASIGILAAVVGLGLLVKK